MTKKFVTQEDYSRLDVEDSRVEPMDDDVSLTSRRRKYIGIAVGLGVVAIVGVAFLIFGVVKLAGNGNDSNNNVQHNGFKSSDSQALLSILQASINPTAGGDVTLSQATLLDNDLYTLFNTGSGVSTITLTNKPACHLKDQADVPFLMCYGTTTLYGVTADASASFKVKDLEKKQFNGAIVIQIHGQFDLMKQLPLSLVTIPSDSWMVSQINLGQVNGTVTLSSISDSLPILLPSDPDVPVEVDVLQGVRLNLSGAFSSQSAAANNGVLNIGVANSALTSAAFDINAYIPLGAAKTGGDSGIIINLTFDTGFNLSNNQGVGTTHLSLQVTGIAKDPASCSIKVTVNLTPTGATSVVSFGLSADWLGTPKDLKMSGGLLSPPWVQPMGLSWLTINAITLSMDVTVGAPASVLNSLTFNGKATFAFSKTGTMDADIHGIINNNGKDVAIATVVNVSGSMSNVVSAMVPLTATTVLNDIIASGSIQLYVTTFDYLDPITAYSASRGLTLIGDSTITGPTLQSLVVVPSTAVIHLNLFVPVFDNPKDTTVAVKVTVDQIALNKAATVLLKESVFTLNAGAASQSIALSSNVVATFDQNPTLTFAVSTSWSSASQEFNLSGNLVNAWTKPFGQTTLTINKAAVTITVTTSAPGSLKALVVTGNVVVAWSKNQVATVFNLNALNDFKSVVFTTTVTIDTLTAPLMALVPSPTVSKLFSDLQTKVNTVATLTIATVDVGLTKRGLTCAVDVSITPNSSTFFLLLPAAGGQSMPIDLTASLYVPIFDDVSMTSVSVHLSAPSIVIKPTLSMTNLDFSIDISKDAQDVSFTANLVATFSNNPSPVTFNVAAKWSSTTALVTLSGGLVQPGWVNPFNQKWLTINDAVLSLAVTYTGTSATLASLGVTADATMTFGNDQLAASILLEGDNNFTDLKFKASLKFTSLSNTVRSILNLPSTTTVSTDSITPQSAELVLYISTLSTPYSDGEFLVHKGLTILIDTVLITGKDLSQRISGISKQLSTTSTFAFDIYIPIFNSDPSNGLTFNLRILNIPIKDDIKLAGVIISVTIGEPMQVSVAGGLSVLFHKQPDWITFWVEGVVATDGTVTIEGAMQGTWTHVFGINGLDISNSWAAISFNPASPIGLSGLGVGGNITYGSSEIAFNSYANAAEPTKLFLRGEADNLSFRDVCMNYNKLKQPTAKEIDVSKMPPLFEINKVVFDIAPEDGDIIIGGFDVHFQQGVHFNSTVTFLGMDQVHLALDTHSTTTGLLDDITLSIDIKFLTMYQIYETWLHSLFDNSEYNPPDLAQKTMEEIGVIIKDLSYIIPQLTIFDVDGFSLKSIAEGHLPQVQIDIVWMGSDHSFTLNRQNMLTRELMAASNDNMILSLDQLNMRLKDLLSTGVIDIRGLLNLPECLISAQCPSARSTCRHIRGQVPTCVAGCDPSSGRAGIFGCVPCISSAECGWSGSAGSCCKSGQCMASSGGSEYCGMCAYGKTCSSPESGCIFTFCTKCLTSLDCLWSGSAGHHCRDGKCQA